MDMTIIGNLLDTASLDELVAIKEAAMAKIKARREEAKLVEKEVKEANKEVALSMKDQVKVGSKVSFSYKGRIATGTVTKLTEKTFHVDATEAGLDGEGMRYIQFAKLSAIVSTPEAVAA